MLDYYESIIQKIHQLLFVNIHNINNKEEFRLELVRLLLRKNKIEHKFTDAQHWGFHEMLAVLAEYRYQLQQNEAGFYDDIILSADYISEWFLERHYK